MSASTDTRLRRALRDGDMSRAAAEQLRLGEPHWKVRASGLGVYSDGVTEAEAWASCVHAAWRYGCTWADVYASGEPVACVALGPALNALVHVRGKSDRAPSEAELLAAGALLRASFTGSPGPACGPGRARR